MKKLIVANWKMNPETVEQARKLVASWEHRMHAVADHVEVVVCAPFVYLPILSHNGHQVKLGAQNVSWSDAGALTGEISVLMMKQWNVQFVILGHSERRLFLGETDSVINAKIGECLKHQMTPIVCLGGEQGAEKEHMKGLVTKQFAAVTKDLVKKQLEKIIYVYEPVWAISTMNKSEPATGEHAVELIEHIYDLLADRIGQAESRNIRVLYGGTVNRNNVSEYSRFPKIDGALVGAASLDSESFWDVVKEFNREAIHHS